MSFMKATVIFKEMLGKILLIFQPAWKVLGVLLLNSGEGQGSTQVFKHPWAELLVPVSLILLLGTAPPGRRASCLQALLPAVTGDGFSNFGLSLMLPAAPH